MRSKAVELLKRYTRKRNVYLTQRGNKSIQTALRIARSLGFTKVVIQDQGGWITYMQYPEQLKLELIKLETDYGIISADTLAKHLDEKTIVLVNSLSGYFAEQPMGLICGMCKQKNSFLINDATGSIGTDNATYGDIVLGSFGDGKPVNLEYGGFMAIEDASGIDPSLLDNLVFEQDKFPALVRQLENLPEKLKEFRKHHQKIKKDLGDMDIIHKNSKGINVIIRFNNISERERIINYCEKNDYAFTECPRYIRVNCDAISIEVKRVKQ